MRRIVVSAIALCLSFHLFAQDSTAPRRPINVRTDTRSSDHFLMQIGYTTWIDKPDSIKTKGFPRTFNMYLMLDFPFKTNPKLSVAIGPGIASDNMYFSKMYVGLKDNTPTLVFRNLADTTHFKKYKLSTVYLEAPVELRFRSNPEDDRKSVKFAIGAKVGTLLSAMVKGKDLQNASGNTLLSYTSKEKSKQYLNRTRLSAMARIGYGPVSLFASYAITPVFKEGVGPQVRPLTVGVTLSGL